MQFALQSNGTLSRFHFIVGNLCAIFELYGKPLMISSLVFVDDILDLLAHVATIGSRGTSKSGYLSP